MRDHLRISEVAFCVLFCGIRVLRVHATVHRDTVEVLPFTETVEVVKDFHLSKLF
jgi:hypothetical protein